MPSQRRGGGDTVEKATLIPLILLTGLTAISALSREQMGEVRGEVKYVSALSVYIDIGEAVGLSEGDTVEVRRGEATISHLIISSTAAHSSSCSPIGSIRDIRIGDTVVGKVRTVEEPAQTEGAGPRAAAGKKTRIKPNLLTGRVSLGSLFSEDFSNSGLGFSEPTLNTRFRLKNLAGKPLSLNFRQKVRHVGRQRSSNALPDADRWIKRVVELALTFEAEGRPVRLSLGRFFPSRVRGIGCIDGGLVEYEVKDKISVGAVGGLRPDYFDTGFRTDEKMFGIFTSYEMGQVKGRAFHLSASYLGSYRDGEVNREFIYLEGNYSRGAKLSTYNSIEIDLNRGWKKSSGESLFQISGVYLSARYKLRDYLSITSSFDNRKNLRTLYNRSVPDSLFDDAIRRGLRAGVSWKLSERIHATGNFGVRFREGVDNTLSASGGLRVRDLFVDRLILNARISVFRTMLTRGYRPYVGFHFPTYHRLMLDISTGSYIYDSGGQVSSYPWVGYTVRYELNGRTYLSSSLWTYLKGGLRSARLFSEIEYLF